MATTLPQDILAVALAARGAVDLRLPRDGEPGGALRAIRSLDAHDCSVELHVLRVERGAIMMEEHDYNPELFHAGAAEEVAGGEARIGAGTWCCGTTAA